MYKINIKSAYTVTDKNKSWAIKLINIQNIIPCYSDQYWHKEYLLSSYFML